MATGKGGFRIAILGCGFIGTAVLQGLVRASRKSMDGPAWSYVASVRSEASLARLQSTFESNQQVEVVRGDVSRVTKDADTVLLGVQPQDMQKLISAPDFSQNLDGKHIISMVAGESIKKIQETIADAAAQRGSSYVPSVSRAIPTIGAKIGDSVTLLSEFSDGQSKQKGLVEELFKRIGDVHYVHENLMNSATALGAVCHALTIEAVEAATDSGVASGTPRDLSQAIAARCLQSAGNLLANDMTPGDLKGAMSTPSGITLNSTVRLGQARMNISDTVRFAVKYANGMSE